MHCYVEISVQGNGCRGDVQMNKKWPKLKIMTGNKNVIFEIKDWTLSETGKMDTNLVHIIKQYQKLIIDRYSKFSK